MKNLLLLSLLFITNLSYSQDEGLRFYDYSYKPNIKTVQFHIEGRFTSYPIMDLKASKPLVLSFDDLDADAKNYTYAIVHCNMYWEQSNLAEMEYMDGFMENQVNDYDYSYTTTRPFTNYRIYLPNNNLTFRKSGNYLIKVYDNQGKKTLALTRRFVITESLVRISPQFVRPSNVSKTRTHQEIDFAVNHENINLKSPQQELRATILQNGRWDNAITNMSPLLTRINEVVFDYQDKIVFPAGKEFRFFDLRNLNYRSMNIASIEPTDNGIEVAVAKDKKRSEMVYLQYTDLNGNFVIGNQDVRVSQFLEDSAATQVAKKVFFGSTLSSDYANVLFSLYNPEPFYDDEVYLFGALSEWQLKPEFKMQYNTAVNGYVVKVQLKQGYYDYAYATVPRTGKVKTANMSTIEGDAQETENTYTILIYFRPFGERYDRVIGTTTFSSGR